MDRLAYAAFLRRVMFDEKWPVLVRRLLLFGQHVLGAPGSHGLLQVRPLSDHQPGRHGQLVAGDDLGKLVVLGGRQRLRRQPDWDTPVLTARDWPRAGPLPARSPSARRSGRSGSS